MKNLKTLFILLLALPFYTACNNDDDNSGTPPVTDPMHGKWTLVSVDGGFAGVDMDFDEGVIVWDFNTTGETVVVVNNYTGEGYSALASGNYNYEFEPNTVTLHQCATTLKVSPVNQEMLFEFGCVNIDGSTMTFNQVGADGFVHTFTKVNQ